MAGCLHIPGIGIGLMPAQQETNPQDQITRSDNKNGRS